MNDRRVIRYAAVTAIGLFGVLTLTGWYLARTSPLRAALPWTARDVQDVLLTREAGRVDYLLRATVTEAEFEAFAERAGMHLMPGAPENLRIQQYWEAPADAPHWWNVRGVPSTTRVVTTPDGVIVATYDEGVLFARSLSPVSLESP